MSIDRLRESWFDLLQGLAVEDCQLGNEIFNNLISLYSQPVRHYHNLEHIQEILSSIQQIKDICQRDYILQLSAWFHDCIYNPQAKDNEELSAIYAQTALTKLNVDPQIIYSVTEIISSTKNHQPLLTNIDNSIFLDLDLAILGTTPTRYLQYAQAIRQEYQHISDRNYRQGRSKVLTQFLTKERIYFTDYFYQRLETTARHNIQTEIELLTSPPAPLLPGEGGEIKN